jgi:hypothetical protein
LRCTVFLDHDRAMPDDLELQKALAGVWNLEHARGRSTSPEQVRVRWDDTKTTADFEVCDAAGLLATGTLHFQIVDAATNGAAIKAYMAASWNKKFPERPTSAATIKVTWLSAAKAEVDIGNAAEVFGAAEWTCISNFPPIISGPYSVPARPWS